MTIDVPSPKQKLDVTELPLDMLSHFGFVEGSFTIGDVLFMIPRVKALDIKTNEVTTTLR